MPVKKQKPKHKQKNNMVGLNKSYNAADVPERETFSLMPNGDYLAIISESEMKPNKKLTGHYLQLTIEILDENFKGRRIWSRLNLDNPNQTAVDIAERDLADIQLAVGVQNVSDSSELHDKPFMVTLKTKPASGVYEATNEVAAYKSSRGADGKMPMAKAKVAEPWEKDESGKPEAAY